LSYVSKPPAKSVWEPIDNEKLSNAVARIDDCLSSVHVIAGVGGSRFIPEFIHDAMERFIEFLTKLSFDRMNDYSHYARLDDLFKRDVLLRAVFSKEKQVTTDMVRRAIAWTEHQLILRQRLWVIDKGTVVDRMEKSILQCLDKHKEATMHDFAKFAHIGDRLQDGGYETLARAYGSLKTAGVIKKIGENRSGYPVFARAWTKEAK
jgi:hypothetical protein